MRAPALWIVSFARLPVSGAGALHLVKNGCIPAQGTRDQGGTIKKGVARASRPTRFSGRVEDGYRFATPWMGVTPYGATRFTTFDLPADSEQANGARHDQSRCARRARLGPVDRRRIDPGAAAACRWRRLRLALLVIGSGLSERYPSCNGYGLGANSWRSFVATQSDNRGSACIS